jgi:thiamine kinase-like enzyme
MIEGYSGCKISVKDGLLEKSTNNNYPADRLEKQIEKQELFSGESYSNIQIPRIIRKRRTKKNFFVEMEYFYSLNIINFLNRSGKCSLDRLSDVVCEFIREISLKCEYADISPDIIHDKYKSVRENINRYNRFCLEDVDKAFYSKFKEKELRLPVGRCHGDLTLSNMLFDNNSIVVIDFLDSFIDSPIVDIAKIRQDTKHRWSLFIHKGECDRRKIEISLDYLDHRFCEEFKVYDFFKYYKLFQVLNLARVIQYSKDEKTTNYIMRELCSI